MLLRLNATGDSINVIGSPLVQGSNAANEIYIEAPLAESLSCSVSIMLPTGTYTSPYIALPKGYDAETGLSTWHFKPDTAVTQYAGQIRINVSFTSAGAIVASVGATATVRAGGYLAEVGEPNADAWAQVQVIYSGIASALSNLMLLVGKSQTVRYYAWVSGGNTLYTLSATPTAGDRAYTIASETPTMISPVIASVDTSTISFSAGATYTRTITSDRILVSTSAEPFDNSIFAELALKAPLESPELTGTPTATTAETTDNSLRIATTAWVKAMLMATPTASTADENDNSGRIATTAWVRLYLSEMAEVFNAITAGEYGNVPDGGATDEVLAKASGANHALKWMSLANFAFDSPTATTQASTDDSTKVATTRFVHNLIIELQDTILGDGVSEAYNTLKELQDAIETNQGGILDALELIASKDNKTLFETFVNNPLDENEDPIPLVLESGHEYRATEAITYRALTLPNPPINAELNLPLKFDFICTLDFTTPSDSDMSYSYVNDPDLYSTGDDCTDGLFIPIANKHYTWVIWYAGGKYQGVVRRSV